VQLHVEAVQGHQAAPDFGALERGAGLRAGLYLLDRPVEQLVDERVAHTLDGSGLLGRELHPREGAGELVTTNLLGPIAKLLYERDDVQRGEPSHELQNPGRDDGLSLLGRFLTTLRVALDDGLEVVYVVEVDAPQGLDHGVYVSRHRDVYKEQRILSLIESLRDQLAPDNPLAGAGRADHHVHLGELLGYPVKMLEIDPDTYRVIRPSGYSVMVWEQKKARAVRDRGSIDWIVMRNRLSMIDSRNTRAMEEAITALSKRIGFRVAPGFGERVIFRELFLKGLTLLDLREPGSGVRINMSHVAARQEVRALLETVGLGLRRARAPLARMNAGRSPP
jgi:hypothetical protein